MSDAVCAVKDLSFYYTKKKLFSGNTERGKGIEAVSFSLKKGEILGIVGESGSGKSTLAKCIAGILQPDGGSVETQKVQMIFQDSYSALNPAKTVRWLLEEALRLTGISSKEWEARIEAILEETELEKELLNRLPKALSGGQRQRVMIAMALLCEPKILIADEPVSALDVTIQKQILGLMQRLCKERELAMIFISHDLRTVYQICDYCMVLKDGKVVEAAAVEDLYANPQNDYTALLLKSAGMNWG
ncbi:MAG: ABC transporter ATP-binding protein [Lachnospiraceae bacterium]|nr:ABC transporter ATP-binding protein [Lachnospiraceae bacterium]